MSTNTSFSSSKTKRTDLLKSISILTLILLSIIATSSLASASTLPAAQPVPGVLALDGATGQSYIWNTSCPFNGYCIALGSSKNYAFFTELVNGKWSDAQLLKGASTLLPNQTDSDTTSVSCTSARNCTVAGIASGSSDPNYFTSPFVINEVNGVWGSPQLLDTKKLFPNSAYVYTNQISCPSVGNCSLEGNAYSQGESNGYTLFIVDQVNGVWGEPHLIPNLSSISSISLKNDSTIGLHCTSTGNCSAIGLYTTPNNVEGVFAVNRVNGVWGNAQTIDISAAGISSPSAGSNPGYKASNITCTTNGNCVAVFPVYFGSPTPGGECTTCGAVATIAVEKNGVWGKAQPILLTNTKFNSTDISSVTCPTTTTCYALISAYVTSNNIEFESYFVKISNGILGSPILLSKTPSSIYGTTISCPTTSACLVVGARSTPATPTSTSTNGQFDVMTMTIVNGVPSAATAVPGLSSLDVKHGGMGLGSCFSNSSCAVGGSYTDGSSLNHAFTWATTISLPKATTITCTKGKISKKVTGVNPVCPSGYKKK